MVYARTVPSLRDSTNFPTLPSTTPSAACWARSFRAHGTRFSVFLLCCRKRDLSSHKDSSFSQRLFRAGLTLFRPAGCTCSHPTSCQTSTQHPISQIHANIVPLCGLDPLRSKIPPNSSSACNSAHHANAGNPCSIPLLLQTRSCAARCPKRTKIAETLRLPDPAANAERGRTDAQTQDCE